MQFHSIDTSKYMPLVDERENLDWKSFQKKISSYESLQINSVHKVGSDDKNNSVFQVTVTVKPNSALNPKAQPEELSFFLKATPKRDLNIFQRAFRVMPLFKQYIGFVQSMELYSKVRKVTNNHSHILPQDFIRHVNHTILGLPSIQLPQSASLEEKTAEIGLSQKGSFDTSTAVLVEKVKKDGLIGASGLWNKLQKTFNTLLSPRLFAVRQAAVRQEEKPDLTQHRFTDFTGIPFKSAPLPNERSGFTLLEEDLLSKEVREHLEPAEKAAIPYILSMANDELIDLVENIQLAEPQGSILNDVYTIDQLEHIRNIVLDVSEPAKFLEVTYQVHLTPREEDAQHLVADVTVRYPLSHMDEKPAYHLTLSTTP
jgi:hypothetical protein